MERGGPCHILGPSRTGLILPKAQSRQQRGEQVDQPQPDAHPDAAEHPQAQDADEKYRVGVVGKRQQPLRLVPAQRTLAVQLRRGPGTDGVAAHQSQQQRGTARRRPPGTAAPSALPARGRPVLQIPAAAAAWRPPERETALGSPTWRTGPVLRRHPAGPVRRPPKTTPVRRTKGDTLSSATAFSSTSPLHPMPFSGGICRKCGQASSPPPLHTVAKR